MITFCIRTVYMNINFSTTLNRFCILFMWANNSYFFFRYSFDVFTSVCSSHMVCLARILCTASLVIWTPIISMSTKIHTGPIFFYNAAKREFFLFLFKLTLTMMEYKSNEYQLPYEELLGNWQTIHRRLMAGQK